MGEVQRIATAWDGDDYLGAFLSRVSAYRMGYTVPPGLYAVGNPGAGSEVYVSANYKLSFDHLRRGLDGLDAWVLVLDTKGINVWCAAGKGTFGTDELIARIRAAGLQRVVSHGRVVLPQLGAPGVKAHIVRKETGFRVVYGPVRAADIREFQKAGLKAAPAMRRVEFPAIDRLVLTPMEINPAMKRYPLFALVVLLVFGLEPSGVIFRSAWQGGWPYLALGLGAVVSGAFITPLALPVIPFRSFAMKGWLAGLAMTGAILAVAGGVPGLVCAGAWVLFPLLSSYMALQFTGSTTFTGISGVKRELRFALPIYIGGIFVTLAIVGVQRMSAWGIL